MAFEFEASCLGVFGVDSLFISTQLSPAHRSLAHRAVDQLALCPVGLERHAEDPILVPLLVLPRPFDLGLVLTAFWVGEFGNTCGSFVGHCYSI